MKNLLHRFISISVSLTVLSLIILVFAPTMIKALSMSHAFIAAIAETIVNFFM